MSSEEEKNQESKKQLEADNKFKVLTQSEYEALLLLSHPTAAAPVSSTGGTMGAKSSIATSTPGAGAKPKFTPASPGLSPLHRLTHRTYGSSNSNWYVKFQMFMSARAFWRVNYFCCFFLFYYTLANGLKRK